MSHCKQCGREFEAKRADALFCSDVCKHRSYRIPDKSVPDNSVKSVPDNPIPDTSQQTPERRAYKRGTDIKCFEDLPADVQLDIATMAASKAGNDEAAYQQERQDRTERAIHYQHIFPDRFYPGGWEVAGPLPADFELCRYCGKPLPVLKQRRHSPGACLDCVMAKHSPISCKPPANQPQIMPVGVG